jgi:TPR repeat protein
MKRKRLINYGYAYCHGTDFRKLDVERGQVIVEASASAGFPMAVASCYRIGWNGLKMDEKKAFDKFVNIQKDTNGYHHAQRMIGYCYQFGHHCNRFEQSS